MKEATTEALATSATSETTGKGGDHGGRGGTKKAKEETTETLATTGHHWPPWRPWHMTTATSATSTPVPCTYVCGPLELYPYGKAKNFPNREGDVDENGRNVLALSARKFLSKSRGVYSKTLYVGHHASNVGK